MSHELLGERFLGRREPAWHNLGQVFTEPITASEAAERTNLAEIFVEKRPMVVRLPLQETPFGNARPTIESDLFALVRHPVAEDQEFRILGTCGKGYGLIQHADLAAKLDPLTGEWPVETMGVLNEGATLFVALDAGEAEVAGDPIRQYFLLTDTKDGGTGISLHFTPVRVVCQNTLTMGKASAVASAKLRHTKGLEAELDWRLDVMRQLQDVADKSLGTLAALASLDLDSDAVERIIAKAYPMPRKPRKVEMAEGLSDEETRRLALKGLLSAMKDAERRWDTERRRIEERRNVVRELLGRFNDQHPQHAGTGWAVYNAVVEFEDFREKQGSEEPHMAALFGMRATTKARAYEAALDELL